MRTRLPTLLALLAALGAVACSEAPSAAPGFDVAVQAYASLPSCGFENGRACPPSPLPEQLRCDHGLRVDQRGTPLNSGDDRCVDDTRHQVGGQFRGTWAAWALANQRQLAIDEPFNWVMHLVTHNANNNVAEGHAEDPNQVWSLSDQLDLGSRGLWLDLHWVFGDVRLCHALVVDVPAELHAGCAASDRPFSYAVREIADWLAANPGEIVFLDLEHYVEERYDQVIEPLNAYLGDRIYRSRDPNRQTNPWPSRRELLAQGKQVMIGVIDDNDFGTLAHLDHKPSTLAITNISEMRVDRTEGIVTECRTVAPFDGDTSLVDYFNHWEFRLVGEDRTVLANGKYGLVSGSSVADMAACNMKFISLDMIGGSLYDRPLANPLPAALRQPHAVWSWAEGDRGAGDAALLQGGSGRWRSASAEERHRFACARPRSETTRDHTGWPDRLGRRWRVTTRAGTWREGGRVCLEEFGAQGYAFSVPVSGYMNGQLRLIDETRGDLWLNYDSMEGSWRINQRPRASAGADRTVECAGHHGTSVQLDASRSGDPDQHSLSYEWRGPFGTAAGPNPTVMLPLGRHEITVIVDDGFAGAAMDTVMIEVVDTTPPEIHSAAANPDTLWPPNHAMVPVAIELLVTDACDASPTCRIVSVSSNEVANGRGDGNTAPDWRITGPLTLELRAERAGPGAGRVYTIVIECTDASGNIASREVSVTVPHDRR